MGRTNSTKLKTNFLIIYVFCICSVVFSQTKITGQIKDSVGVIQSASVVLKDSTNKTIFAYTYTNAKGYYLIQTNKTGSLNLQFSSLGYASKIIPITIDGSKRTIPIDVVLVEKPMTLNEVIIHADKPISIKKDTISFKTKFFLDGTEHTVENLLKKIPGVQVDRQGTIKVGNQEIEKLMVDGDDLFEKGYRILSKNMPAYPIEEVEVLKNFSNNRLLKNIEESNKVALNLKLNEKSKRIWFGNIEAGLGNDNFYEFKSNLMNFGKKNKYYFLTNLNTIGTDATGNIQQLIKPFRVNEPASVGDNQQVNNLMSLSSPILSFKESRTNFNNAELLSLNAIFNPTPKLKIKTLGFFNCDEANFYRNTIDIVDVDGTDFLNTEDYKISNKKRIAFGKVDLTYNMSKTKMLESTTKYNDGNYIDGSNLIFNGNSTLENLKHSNTLFDQKISYTNKFKDKKVFLLTGRYTYEKAPQNYNINQFFYQDLFPESSSANNVVQQSTNQMEFAGFNAHVLDRKQNGDLLELQLGNVYRKDKLSTTFSLFENDNLLIRPTNFKNRTVFEVNDLYLKSKYRYKMKDFTLVGKLAFHQLLNALRNESSKKNQTSFYVNPSIGFDWEINEKNKITSSYSYSTTNAKILDVYNNFVLRGFRSFSKGTNDFNQLNSSSVVLNYQLGNWSDRFFTNTFILYSKNHDFFSTNTLIEQNYTQSEKILIKNRHFFTINSKIDYYIKKLSSNFKLDIEYSISDYKNIINDLDLREVESTNYNYGFEVRSGFNGIFNYHFGTKWNTNEVKTTQSNSFTNNISFLDLSFVFNKKFDAQIQSERYHFGNLDTDKAYYFFDFMSRYKIKEDKLTLSISGKNLFNAKTFRNVSISDVGSSTREYRLLPRYIMLKMEYKF